MKFDSSMKIMFVCKGNICRSPLAHAVFAKKVRDAGLSDRFAIESSGTISHHVGYPPDPRTVAVGAAHGVSVTHLARHLKPADLDNYDRIFVMDRDNLATVLALAKTELQRSRVKLFRAFDSDTRDGDEVPDPYYGGERGFEEVFAIVDRTSERLLAALIATEEEASTES